VKDRGVEIVDGKRLFPRCDFVLAHPETFDLFQTFGHAGELEILVIGISHPQSRPAAQRHLTRSEDNRNPQRIATQKIAVTRLLERASSDCIPEALAERS